MLPVAVVQAIFICFFTNVWYVARVRSGHLSIECFGAQVCHMVLALDPTHVQSFDLTSSRSHTCATLCFERPIPCLHWLSPLCIACTSLPSHSSPYSWSPSLMGESANGATAGVPSAGKDPLTHRKQMQITTEATRRPGGLGRSAGPAPASSRSGRNRTISSPPPPFAGLHPEPLSGSAGVSPTVPV